MSDAATLRGQAVRGARWSGGSTLGTTLIQLAQLGVLARFLTPSDFGLMGMTLVVLALTQGFADAGVSMAIIHRQRISRRQLSSLFWLNLFCALALYLVVVAATPLIVRVFSEPKLGPLVPYAALVLVTTAVGMQFQVLFQKELAFHLLARVALLAALSGAATAVGLAVGGAGVWALVWGSLVQTSVSSVLLLAWGWRRWRPGLHFAPADLRGFAGFGLYQMAERGINQFNARVDQLVLGTLLGAQALGYYSFAFNLVMQPSSRLAQVVTQVSFPVFARVQGDRDRLREGYLQVVRLLTTVSAPLLLGLAAVAPLAIPTVFGPQWRPAVRVVQLLCVYALLRATGSPVGSLLLAKGRADRAFHWNLGLLLLVGPTVYLGFRAGGVLGVAGALVGLQAVLGFAAYFLLVRPLTGACGQRYADAIATPLALAAAMAAAVALVGYPQGWLGGGAALALQVLTGVGVYLALLRGLDREALRAVRMMVGARPA